MTRKLFYYINLLLTLLSLTILIGKIVTIQRRLKSQIFENLILKELLDDKRKNDDLFYIYPKETYGEFIDI